MQLPEILTLLRTNSISSLSFTKDNLEPEQAAAFASALSENDSLKELSLEIDVITLDGGIKLVKAIARHPKLNGLILSLGLLTSRLLPVFTECSQTNTCLQYLDLSENGLKHNTALALQFMLYKHKGLQNLNLIDNRLSAKSAKLLGKALLSNDTLQSLFLNYNPIRDKGVERLMPCLFYNQALQSLSLEGIGMSDRGAASVAFFLKNKSTLLMLDLNDNNITDIGVACIAEGLTYNTSLIKVDLSYNKITSSGADTLAKTLLKNKHLVSLHLAGNQIENAGFQDLAKALQTSHSQIYLDLSSNRITDEAVLPYVLGEIDKSLLLRINLYNNRVSFPIIKSWLNQLKDNNNRSDALLLKLQEATAKHQRLQETLRKQACLMLNIARLFIQARNSTGATLQVMPHEIQEQIVNHLDDEPLPNWQERNIWDYAQQRPQLGASRAYFLRYTLFHNKPIRMLDIVDELKRDLQRQEKAIHR